MHALLPFLGLQQQLNTINGSVSMATTAKTPKEKTGRGQRAKASNLADNQHMSLIRV